MVGIYPSVLDAAISSELPGLHALRSALPKRSERLSVLDGIAIATRDRDQIKQVERSEFHSRRGTCRAARVLLL